MNTTQLGVLVAYQSFRFTEVGLSQLFQLKPELIGTVTIDQIWRKQEKSGRSIVFTFGQFSIAIDSPVSFEVTTRLV